MFPSTETSRELKASSDFAALVEKHLASHINGRKRINGVQDRYLDRIKIAMSVALRNLNVVYKGRNLDFQENEKLRNAYLEAIRADVEFGTGIHEFLRNLPAMVTGSIVAIIVGMTVGSETDISQYTGLQKILAGAVILVAALIGFWVKRLFTWLSVKKKKRLYVLQDYERNLYFKNYLKKGEKILQELLMELHTIHNGIFKTKSQGLMEDKKEVSRMVMQQHPTWCKYIYQHRRENKITPEVWAYCENGNEIAKELCCY